jgi:hypothetical protein
MCEPTTILLATTAIVGAYAAYSSGQSQEEFANYEAKQAEADARAEQGAAQVEAERIRKAGKQAAGEARAALAGSGQDVTSAGALAINREIYRGAEEDAYFALLGGRDRATRLNTDAQLSRSRGREAGRAGTLGAYSSLLQGGTQAYGVWRTSRTTTSGQNNGGRG